MSENSQWPIASIIATISTEAPYGWLLCNGQTIDPKYNQLIALIGRNNTPNLAGYVLVGAGQAVDNTKDKTVNLPENTQFSLSAFGGEFQHQINEEEMPAHSHNVSKISVWDEHAKVNDDDDNYLITTDGSSAPIATDAAGGNKAHNNMQPYYVVNYIIYAGDA